MGRQSTKSIKTEEISSPPLKQRRFDEFPSTPVARPWKAQVKSAKENYHKNKRVSQRSSNSPQVPLRRSARLSGVGVNTFEINLPTLSMIDKQIHIRMNELQNIDTHELKRKLKKQGQIKFTPKAKGRPTYDLQNPDSIIRKFIDEEATRLLETEREEEFNQRPGAAYFRRDIFSE